MNRILILLPALWFAGCETAPKPQTKIVRKVVVVGDTHCRLGGHDSWDVRDTKKSIQDARRRNAKYDRTCSKAKTSKRKTS